MTIPHTCTVQSTRNNILACNLVAILYDEESDHSNKAVRKTPEIESGHKVSEEVK